MNNILIHFFSLKNISKVFGFVFMVGVNVSFAQNNIKNIEKVKDTSTILLDTSKGKKVKIPMKVVDEYIDNIVINGFKESKLHLNNNKLIQWQNTNFNLIKSEIQNAHFKLKQGIDYQNFTTELNLLIKLKEETVEGITFKRDKIQTIRNLSTTYVLLQEISKRTNDKLLSIKEINQSFSSIQNTIDSLTTNKKLYIVPSDSVAKINYFQRLLFMTKDLKVVNDKMKNAIDSIQELQVMGDIFKFSLESDLATINRERKIIHDNGELTSNESIKNEERFGLIYNFEYSFKKGFLVLLYYYINHNDTLLLLIIFTLALSIYFKVLKSKYKKAKLYNEIQYPKQIFTYSFLSSIVIVFTISQFLIPLPPFIFTALLWIITSLALTMILRKSISKYWFKVWLLVLIFSTIAIFNNLVLRYLKSEEIFIVLMNICGILFGLFLIYNNKKPNRYFIEKTIYISVIILILFEFLSLGSLIYGNYNISKMFMTNGFFTVLIAYLMVWTNYLINDVITLSYYLKETDEEREKLVLDDNKKISTIIYILFLCGWLFLISRNTYFFQSLAEPLKKILFQPRTFGEFTFTYSTIIVFFVVIFISGFISRLVSFIATETRTIEKNNRRSGVGSWLLLIRIGIISLGIVIAFASAGIPMDKLALIISALGVGIGFGLQNLVNNLVSGLIIAFEKPVNLDDVIEVAGQSGKMKSIGIRSSVVTTWQGSDVIIPNGDLLSNNLINWTLGNSKRRIDFNLGVAYSSDLGQVITVIKTVLDNDARVLKTPEYCIQVNNFNDSSIDFAIKFWVQHFEFGLDVKSDVLIAIDKKFKENNIEIPFPQQDIHIKFNEKNN